MSALFLRTLNMSITAGWIVLAVLLVRLVLRNAPKALRVVLWSFVGVRLLFPISVESVLSLIPSVETVPEEILYTDAPVIHSGISFLNQTVNPILADKLAPSADAGVSPAQKLTEAAMYIWLAGVVLMVLYTVISYLRIYRKVREATPLSANQIRLCDHISTPFILGVVRPRIYLPSAMSERDIGYVIAHEMAHLKRRDHWWKPLGFILLTVHWFNPLLWVAYVLFCRDIELACDEKVIRELGTENKKSYSDALINCSIPRRMIAACPLAFGEVGVKERIKSVLRYKKPRLWIIIVGVVACIAVAACFLSDPPGGGRKQTQTDAFGATEIPTVPVRYVFKDSVDPLPPDILLNYHEQGKSFMFMYSAYSSYLPFGIYEVVDDDLILHTEDQTYTYVFKIVEKGLIFDASRSSEIPSYRYSGDSYETECPVPDGAFFERELFPLPDAEKVMSDVFSHGFRSGSLRSDCKMGHFLVL